MPSPIRNVGERVPTPKRIQEIAIRKTVIKPRTIAVMYALRALCSYTATLYAIHLGSSCIEEALEQDIKK
jgi:hypothetical protein